MAVQGLPDVRSHDGQTQSEESLEVRWHSGARLPLPARVGARNDELLLVHLAAALHQ